MKIFSVFWRCNFLREVAMGKPGGKQREPKNFEGGLE